MNEKNGTYTSTKLIKRVYNADDKETYTEYSTGLSYNSIHRVKKIFNTEDLDDRKKRMALHIRATDERYTYYKYVGKEWVETDRWDALVYAYDLQK